MAVTWFVSWSKGSQLEPNDGGARPGSLVPMRSVSRGGRHSSADPGLAWSGLATHNAGGVHIA